MHPRKSMFLIGFVLCIFVVFGLPQDRDDEKEIFSQLRHTHRINAHGDEFTSMAMSPDGKRLAIGTEKGDVIVWNVAAGKLEKQLKQGKPIHEVLFTDNNHVVIAGGNHTGLHNCLFGKLDLETGRLEEWVGAGNDSLMYLSSDDKTGVISTATMAGHITVWDANTGKKRADWDSKKTVLGLAVAGEKVYVSRTDIDLTKERGEDEELIAEVVTYSADAPGTAEKIFIPKQGAQAINLKFSVDKNILAVNLYQAAGAVVAFFDPVSAKKIASLEGSGNVKWISKDRMLISDNEEPLKFCTISPDGKITTDEINKGGGFHGSGSPVDVSGQAVSADEKFIWLSYKKIGALGEFDLTKKEAKLLIELLPFPYAMDAREYSGNRGYLVTAGDDKFARVWNLSDLSLVREIQTDKTPQGVALLPDGKRFVYSNSGDVPPTDIFTVDIATGSRKKILTIDTPFVGVRAASTDFVYEGRVAEAKKTESTSKNGDGDNEVKYVTKRLILASAEDGKTIREFSFKDGISKYAGSSNLSWIAVADGRGVLWRINLSNGSIDEYQDGKIDSPTQIAITNDGRYIYTTEWYAKLKQWDTQTRKSKIVLDGFRGQASCLRLSNDEKFAIIGGNHFDLGVYEIATGKTGFYTRVDASDFYVPQAWMKGNRIIYITDGGVMFDGIFSK